MLEFFELMGKSAPVYLPILAAILTIVFTKSYVYRGMVPESMVKDQIDREKTLLNEQAERDQQRLKDQADRDKQVIEIAKDLEQHLEEIVYQLQSLTTKTAQEIGENNTRITALERFLSDQIDAIREHSTAIQQLAFQCERHRKNIPDTQVFRKETTTS